MRQDNLCALATFALSRMVASVQLDGLADDPLATRFFDVLIRMVKGSQPQAMQITATYDLTMTQLRLLHVLDHAAEPLPVSALGEAVGLSVAAAGRAVDALHRIGLVSRNEDPIDRRVKRIALSSAGTEAIEQITRARLAGISEFVSGLDPDERASLEEAVDTLAALAATHLPGFVPGCAVPGSPAGAAATDVSPNQTEATA